MNISIAPRSALAPGADRGIRLTRWMRGLPGPYRRYAGHDGGTTATSGKGKVKLMTDSWADVGCPVPQPHRLARWCAGALVLLLPGSFIILALLWLCRRHVVPSTRT